MGVKLQSSLGGSVEIAAPVTASNYVLTAPATSSTIDTLARTGNVLQVVSATYSTQTSSSSSTYVDTGLTATITPTSATSKILVLVSQNGVAKINNTAVDIKLLRASTQIARVVAVGSTGTTTNNFVGSSVLAKLDSPATASPVTYKTQFASNGNVATAYVQASGDDSNITLMEIAG